MTENETKMLGIIGTPIKHSMSPKMHEFLAKKYNQNVVYDIYDVGENDFKDKVLELKSDLTGFNITSPYKIKIMEYLDEFSEQAGILGSVNTAFVKEGKWYGLSTDGDGFCESLKISGTDIKNKKILMLGAGGAARSLSYKLSENGAKSITIHSRTKEKIHIIGDMVEKYFKTEFYDEFDKNCDYDILINATPIGMHPNTDENPCSFMEIINENMTVADLIYSPSETLLLKLAKEKGAKTLNGMGMLAMQGILAFQKFCGIKTKEKEDYFELLDLLKI